MKLRVDMLGTQDDGSQKIEASFFFENGVVTCTNDKFMELMEAEGIVGKGGKLYFPSDGLAFMKNLQHEFSGSMLRASAPKPA